MYCTPCCEPWNLRNFIDHGTLCLSVCEPQAEYSFSSWSEISSVCWKYKGKYGKRTNQVSQFIYTDHLSTGTNKNSGLDLTNNIQETEQIP